MALNDYTDDELMQELERRQYEKDDAQLIIENNRDSGLYITRSGCELNITQGINSWRVTGTQLRCLQVMVNFARHYSKKDGKKT